MAAMKHITSSKNPEIKKALKLRKRREREQSQCFLIEGYRELLRGVQYAIQIDTLFFCEELFLGSQEQELIRAVLSQGGKVAACSVRVFHALSYRDRPDGLLAIAHQRHLELQDLKVDENSVYILAESIEKPGNLGTILRSADAAGAAGVVVCDRCTDIYNPNVVRASIGTLFSLPVVEAKAEEVISWLKKQEITLIATSPSASLEYTQADLKGKIAIAVGTEQYGLTDTWFAAAGIKLKIPMCGVADSLNVATATTLLLYETLRQRKKHYSL